MKSCKIFFFLFALSLASRASADVLLTYSFSVPNFVWNVNGSKLTPTEAQLVQNLASSPFGNCAIYGSKTDICVSNDIYTVTYHKANQSTKLIIPDLQQYAVVDNGVLTSTGRGLWGFSEPEISNSGLLLTDLHADRMFFGHKAHEYRLAIAAKNGDMSVDGTVWLCTDFPELDALNHASFSTSTWIDFAFAHVKGIPLKLDCDVHVSHTVVHADFEVSGVMTDGLPSMHFDPPHGFTRIAVDKEHVKVLQKTIPQSLGLRLAESPADELSSRTFTLAQAGKSLGSIITIGAPKHLGGIFLATGKWPGFASAPSGYNASTADDGAPIQEELAEDASTKTTVRYSGDKIVVHRPVGSSLTFPIPSTLPVYSIADYATGFARLNHLNLGCVGLGSVFDFTSIKVKLAEISLVDVDATLHDPVLGDRDKLSKYVVSTGDWTSTVYEDSPGNILAVRMPGGLSLTRQSGLQTQLNQTAPPAWFNLPNADAAVHSDVPLDSLSKCKTLTVEISEVGSKSDIVENHPPASIDHDGAIDDVRASSDLRPYLDNSPLFALNDPSIKRQAEEIRSGSVDLCDIAARTCDWVNHAMIYSGSTMITDKRNADQILASKQGVCRDFAVLYTALARAEGAPTRLCSGIVDVDKKFGYHEWAETYLGKKYGWVAIDPTFDQHIADATHITVSYGDDDVPDGTTFHILSAGQ